MTDYQVILLSVAGLIAAIYIISRFVGKDFMSKIIQWKPIVAAVGA